MVRLARSLTLILAIGTFGGLIQGVGGTAGTVDDCGDSPFDSPCVIQESQIAVKTFIAGNIEEPGDIDVFQFEVRAEDVGSLYLIETIIPDGDPFSDTYLRLLGKDGTSEIVSDNDSGVGGGSKILWSPEEAGNYFAEVTQFFSTEIGLYQIAVFRAGIAPPGQKPEMPQPMPNTAEPPIRYLSSWVLVGTRKPFSNTGAVRWPKTSL